jgi:Arc/MetJ family transcription regulator
MSNKEDAGHIVAGDRERWLAKRYGQVIALSGRPSGVQWPERVRRVESIFANVYEKRLDTHRDDFVRTNIDIDDELLAKAMAASGKSTKKDTVHEALELLVRVKKGQTALRKLRGKIRWEGDLDVMRRG